MKVFISADIEGVTGVTHWDETDMNKADYAACREQMTAEVAAACEGALQAGATEILIKDAHDGARNLIAARLPRQARLIRGWSGHPFMMVQELDSSFHAAMLIGYHSSAGAGGNPLAHTMSGKITSITLNGADASEFLLHTLAAHSVGVPMVFLSGDQGLCDDVRRFNPHIGTVAVKEGRGNSTISIHPELALEKIRDGAKQALAGDVKRCLNPMPGQFSLSIRYRDMAQAATFGYYPGARQVDAHTVTFDTPDYFDVMRFMLFAS